MMNDDDAPPAEDMDPETRKFLMLARKLRAKAEWDYVDGWYTSDVDRASNTAKREFAVNLAELIDETFEFDSDLTREDRTGGRYRFQP